jgi:hypothetical protein
MRGGKIGALIGLVVGVLSGGLIWLALSFINGDYGLTDRGLRALIALALLETVVGFFWGAIEDVGSPKKEKSREELIKGAFEQPQDPRIAALWQARRDSLLAEADRLGAPSKVRGSWGELEEWVDAHRSAEKK